jgi:hypothetical protein
VGHHRFKVLLEVTVAEPGASNDPPGPVDQALAEDLSRAIRKVKPKKGAKEYIVEQVKQVS